MVFRYIDELSSATEGLKIFGKDNTLIQPLLDSLPESSRDVANALMRTALHKLSFRDELDAQLIRYVTDFQVMTKLARPTTALQNFTQRFINPALELGPTAMLKGLIQRRLTPRMAKEFADQAGATFRLYESAYSSVATKTGSLRQAMLSNPVLGNFFGVEKGNRITSAIIGKMQKDILSAKTL